MKTRIPRLLIAGTSSGCGKTSVVCALLQAFKNRALRPAAFKCGPDYIDPMFHREIIGAKSGNLDSFFMDDNTVKYLLSRNSEDCDISIIEGVMGYYDGLGINSSRAGSYELAGITETAAVLVVDAKGAALSSLAVIEGFLNFYPESGIKGVILNRCSEMSYKILKEEIEKRFSGKVLPLGYMPQMENCSLDSRRLGLVSPEETENIRQKLQTLAAQAEKSIDMEGLLKLAEESPELEYEEIKIKKYREKVRIAVAADKAFCFYYEDNLRLLEEMGAEIIRFSPLDDETLPDNIQGLYLGGGYPELHAEKLSANISMLQSIKKAVSGGLPTIAECGGFMYLTEEISGFPMAGVIKGSCHDTGRPSRFGYINLTAKKDSLILRAGDSIPAHEFHYWDCENSGSDFEAMKISGRSWECAYGEENLYAGFPHLHFCADLKIAENFYEACLREKNND